MQTLRVAQSLRTWGPVPLCSRGPRVKNTRRSYVTGTGKQSFEVLVNHELQSTNAVEIQESPKLEKQQLNEQQQELQQPTREVPS